MKNKRHFKNYDYDNDEELTIRDYKRMKDKKRYRNMDNAFRSKNIDAIMNYVEEDLEDEYEDEYEDD